MQFEILIVPAAVPGTKKVTPCVFTLVRLVVAPVPLNDICAPVKGTGFVVPYEVSNASPAAVKVVLEAIDSGTRTDRAVECFLTTISVVVEVDALIWPPAEDRLALKCLIPTAEALYRWEAVHKPLVPIVLFVVLLSPHLTMT